MIGFAETAAGFEIAQPVKYLPLGERRAARAARCGRKSRRTTRPALVVLGTVMRFNAVGANEFQASSERLSDEEIASIVTDLTEGLALFTGNTFTSFSTVQIERPAAGVRVDSLRPGAIVVGLAHALLPYSVLTIMGSLHGVNPNLELAAMSLGASRTRTFVNVVLPLSLPGIAGGFILVFSIAISAYATPAILGGPATQVAATAIYSFMVQLLDWSIGAALAVILILSSFSLLYVAARLGARQAAI